MCRIGEGADLYIDRRYETDPGSTESIEGRAVAAGGRHHAIDWRLDSEHRISAAARHSGDLGHGDGQCRYTGCECGGQHQHSRGERRSDDWFHEKHPDGCNGQLQPHGVERNQLRYDLPPTNDKAFGDGSREPVVGCASPLEIGPPGTKARPLFEFGIFMEAFYPENANSSRTLPGGWSFPRYSWGMTTHVC